MPRLTFDITAMDFATMDSVSDTTLLRQLVARTVDYPLLTPERLGHTSASPFLERALVADALAAQNPGLPAPPVEARYVVAGQQAGLLTGPLYTFLKAISAISLARDMVEKDAAPILPLFWIAGEDHDVLEVNRVTIHGHRFVHAYDAPLARGQVPQVADIPLHDAREPLLAFLADALPATEFKSGVLDLVADADFSNYLTAFAGVLRQLLAGSSLRLVDPITLRALTAPVLAALVERWPDVASAFERGSAHVEAQGLTPPLGAPGFFEIVDGRRVAVAIHGDEVVLAAGRVSLADAAAMIRKEPARFSAGAALRPICQDAALPVLATVGGPSELIYLWQILPIYDVIGVIPSLRRPRISATFLSSSTARTVQKAGLTLERIFTAPALLHAPAGEGPLMAADQAVAARSEALLAAIDGIPLSPAPRWLRQSREAIARAAARLRTQLRREQLEAAGLTLRRLERIAQAVLPEGRLQERLTNVLQWVSLYGDGFVSTALTELDPWELRHQLVVIDQERAAGDHGTEED